MAATTLLRNGIDYVVEDHTLVRQLFDNFHEAQTDAAKYDIMRKVIREVSTHASAEERHVYSLIPTKLADQGGQMLYDRHVLDDTLNKYALDFLERHHPSTPAEWELYHATAEKFIMIELDHFAREEQMLTMLNEVLTDEEKDRLWTAFDKAKKNAPLHPHPSGPSGAWGATLMHPAVGAMDRAVEAVRGVVPDMHVMVGNVQEQAAKLAGKHVAAGGNLGHP